MALKTDVGGLLEQELDYGSVTESRETFLKLIEALESKPWLRHVVTKHGTPRAVLMSHRAYQVLMRAAKHALEMESRQADTPAVAAFQRMAAEHWPEAGSEFEQQASQVEGLARARALAASAGLTIVSKGDIYSMVKTAVDEVQKKVSLFTGEARFEGFPGVEVKLYPKSYFRKKMKTLKAKKGIKTIELKDGFLLIRQD